MKKERSVPMSLTESKSNEYGVVFYSTAEKKAMGFTGNKPKPNFFYRFMTVEQMTAEMDKFLARVKDEGDKRAAEKAKDEAYDASRDFKVGDVVFNSWGYDQTNQTAYKVLSVTKRFLTLAEIETAITESSPMSMSGHAMPIPDKVIGKPEKHSVWLYGEEPCVRFKYGSGRKWNGKPQGCSWYA